MRTSTKIVLAAWAAVVALLVVWFAGLIAAILLLGAIYLALFISAAYAVFFEIRYGKKRSKHQSQL